MANSNIPSPDELRKEVSDFLKKQYGDRVVVPPEPNKGGGTGDDGVKDKPKKPDLNFDLKPSQLEAHLNKYVVQQHDTVEIVATKICTHFNRMKMESRQSEWKELVGNIKSNILMIGPTGVGKTYLIKLIADKIGVPFVKGDATKFSETGYVGADVEDLIRSLVHEADGDIQLAEYGIIYLDEIDKIASSKSSYGPDVSRTGVQRNLLKLMEESEVDLKTPHDLASQMEAAMEAQRTGKVARKRINTKNILFVMSGAFSGLDDMIQKRLNRQPVGFRSLADQEQTIEMDAFSIMKNVKSEDLIEYGFESEFVGRLPVVVTLNDLDVDGLYKILQNENSTVIQGKKRDFKAYGIDIEFDEAALFRVAELAHEERTGARGLVNVMDRILLKFEKSLPDTDITHFTVTREVVDYPQHELDQLVTKAALKKFQKRFLATNGIVITFTQEAIEIIAKKAKIENKSFDQICTDMLHDYEYGLRLLKAEEFAVDADIVENPKERLEELIKSAYKGNL